MKPNPTDGHIAIDLVLDNNTIADLRIVSLAGATVQQLLHRRVDKGAYSFVADLKVQNVGVFFVLLKSNEGMLYTQVAVEPTSR